MGRPIAFEVTQITIGPKHHPFGYIGQSLTIPCNESSRTSVDRVAQPNHQTKSLSFRQLTVHRFALFGRCVSASANSVCANSTCQLS